MKKIFFCIYILLSSKVTSAQVTFLIDNFSKDYFGKVYIQDTSEVFSKGWVAIYDRHSKKQLIKETSEALALSLHDGKALANIKSLPYGEQSLVMYEDFNFDGKPDFAICNGQFSCYNGPSFEIYLATAKGFVHNADFSRLAQDYCGMFQVNDEDKTISTMTKDGCCWHEFSTFKVINNRPFAINIITQQYKSPFVINIEETWNGKKMIKKSITTIEPTEEGTNVIASFNISKSGKKVMLFNLNDRVLTYAFLNKDSTVAFFYPKELVYQNPDFYFDSTNDSLSVSFTNQKVEYIIYETKTETGIIIKQKGKTTLWKGDFLSKQGSLRRLEEIDLDNVNFHQ